MAQNESEIRYLTPPTVEVKKKKYCRFKKKIIVLLRAKIIKLITDTNYVESVRNRFHCNSRFI